MNRHPIVRHLVARRIRLGISQQELAEHAGLTRPHLSLIENGRYHPRLDTLDAIATALGCRLTIEVDGA